MNCPKCALPKIIGATHCGCGFEFPPDETGRPRLTEMTELPRARRSNGGMTMLIGLAMAIGGGWLARQAYADNAPNTDLRYVIGYCTAGAGVLSFRRGWDRSTD